MQVWNRKLTGSRIPNRKLTERGESNVNNVQIGIFQLRDAKTEIFKLPQ